MIEYLTKKRVSVLEMFFALIAYGFFMHGQILPALTAMAICWLAGAYSTHRRAEPGE